MKLNSLKKMALAAAMSVAALGATAKAERRAGRKSGRTKGRVNTQTIFIINLSLVDEGAHHHLDSEGKRVCSHFAHQQHRHLLFPN